jgi:hypothetical protein
MNDEPKLGPCCICESSEDVYVIIMLPQRCVVPGHGWGCVVCDLPPDGALAVICEECEPIYRADETVLRFACRGYPASEGRVPIAELPADPFYHDPTKHVEEGMEAKEE